MASGSQKLPPKPEVALALLQTATSVFVHLDPRGDDVQVPSWFKKQPQLVLQIGLNMAVPIVDLDVGAEGISCTLSFNRSPEFCRLPWKAIYGLVGEDGRGMIWPDSVPREVAAAAEGRASAAQATKARKPKLEVARSDKASPDHRDEEKASKRPGKKVQERSARASRGGARTGLSDLEQVNKPGSTPERRGAKPERSSSAASPKLGKVGSSTEKSTSTKKQAAPAGEKSAPRRELPPYLRIVK